METTFMGKFGLEITKLGMGTMTLGKQVERHVSFRILDKAYDAGIRLFDCADIYPLGGGVTLAGETERIIGEWMQTKPRKDLIITSKCFARTDDSLNGAGLGRAHILYAVDASLKRLKTDHIDLYMAHAFDENVPLEETLRAFEDIVLAGKVRYIGVSNWAAWQMSKALGIASMRGYLPFICDELRYNLLFRRAEKEIFPMCRTEGMGIIAYNPLAGGLLSGKYTSHLVPADGSRFDLAVGGELYHERYWYQAVLKAVDTYCGLCRAWGRNPVTTAVQWALLQKNINCVLIGASRPEQLEDSLAACSAQPLDAEQLDALDALWYALPRYKGENLH